MLKKGLLSDDFYTKSLELRQKMTPLLKDHLFRQIECNNGSAPSGFETLLLFSHASFTFSAPLLMRLSLEDLPEKPSELGISRVAIKRVNQSLWEMVDSLASPSDAKVKESKMQDFALAYEKLMGQLDMVADKHYAQEQLPSKKVINHENKPSSSITASLKKAANAIKKIDRTSEKTCTYPELTLAAVVSMVQSGAALSNREAD